MKKFRMMLPVLAVVFAVAGAFAGSLMAPIQAYYKVGSNCSQATHLTIQSTCQTGLPQNKPQCTVDVSGTSYPAFNDEDCLVALRYNIPQ